MVYSVSFMGMYMVCIQFSDQHREPLVFVLLTSLLQQVLVAGHFCDTPNHPPVRRPTHRLRQNHTRITTIASEAIWLALVYVYVYVYVYMYIYIYSYVYNIKYDIICMTYEYIL